MALEKTPNKGLSLPRHFDPAVKELVDNMSKIDGDLIPDSKVTHTSMNLNDNVFLKSGRYVVKNPSGGCPAHSSITAVTTGTSAPSYSYASANYTYILDVVNDGVNITQFLTISGVNSLMQWVRFRAIGTTAWTGTANYWVKIYGGVNMGANTGSDADKLDGQHGTYYATASHSTPAASSSTAGHTRITAGHNSTGSAGAAGTMVRSFRDRSGGSANLDTESVFREEGDWQFYNLSSTTGFPAGETWAGATTSHLKVFRMYGNGTGGIQMLTKEGQPNLWIRNIGGTWAKMWNSLNLVQGHDGGFNADKLDGKHLSEVMSDVNSLPDGTSIKRRTNDNKWEARADTGIITADTAVFSNNESETSLSAFLRIKGKINGLISTIAGGTSAQYFRGDKIWRDFMTDVRATTLTGLNVTDTADITASSTFLQAIGRLKHQVDTKKPVYNGTSTTGASTTAKAVTCAGFTRVEGSIVIVKFTYANTALSPTLNVNSTGAAAIRFNNAQATGPLWAANSFAMFQFDGTYYQLLTTQLQADWAQANANAPDFIKNKGLVNRMLLIEESKTASQTLALLSNAGITTSSYLQIVAVGGGGGGGAFGGRQTNYNSGGGGGGGSGHVAIQAGTLSSLSQAITIGRGAVQDLSQGAVQTTATATTFGTLTAKPGDNGDGPLNYAGGSGGSGDSNGGSGGTSSVDSRTGGGGGGGGAGGVIIVGSTYTRGGNGGNGGNGRDLLGGTEGQGTPGTINGGSGGQGGACASSVSSWGYTGHSGSNGSGYGAGGGGTFGYTPSLYGNNGADGVVIIYY